MQKRYEYVAVDIPAMSKMSERLDDKISAKLNQVAEHGYRFVGVLPGPSKLNLGYAVMEREVSDS
ncbi:hypothetical protein [Aeromicrobium piscarium]|uniref:DUF4177 domain-containing protein n=1 Tax=Aeromicrobium piscarium TaxID=2590901 RepID=A0A554SP52_9ACTN|nr:hypothetical protein [Aeromicrobium piscarium]TSD68136.1 hypothetical protein FNM00_00630 [Aeromicrobium piscarium]